MIFFISEKMHFFCEKQTNRQLKTQTKKHMIQMKEMKFTNKKSNYFEKCEDISGWFFLN